MKRHILPALVAIALALFFTGCANVTVKEVPFVPGTDTSNVNIFIDNNTGKVILAGQVKRGIDKHNIEKHLRETHGYTEISNQLTVQ